VRATGMDGYAPDTVGSPWCMWQRLCHFWLQQAELHSASFCCLVSYCTLCCPELGLLCCAVLQRLQKPRPCRSLCTSSTRC
jgi:hypothetical protein